jgi:hypothetical protein
MNPGNDLLLLAGKIVTIILQAVVGIGIAALAIALPALAIYRGEIVDVLADGRHIPLADLPLAPAIGLLLALLLVLAALFMFFGKLRAIIATVGEGDPFAPANAQRLSRMAWLMLGVQVLTWPAALFAAELADWASQYEDFTLDLSGDGFDLTGILLVIILFILARVFRHGAAMREDLEGTV